MPAVLVSRTDLKKLPIVAHIDERQLAIFSSATKREIKLEERDLFSYIKVVYTQSLHRKGVLFSFSTAD